jgi:hypothetical protein
MFITHMTVTFAGGTPDEHVTSLPTTVMQTWNPVDASGIKQLASLLAIEYDLDVDWESFEHNDETKAGSVDFFDSDDCTEALMSAVWGYNELDDPDAGEEFELPVDLHRDVIGVLTPEQVNEFWACVNPELEPMDFFDDVLRRLMLTPAEHDFADRFVMKQVLALQWWRAFPTTQAGHQAILVKPDLTVAVLDQINSMAMRCFLDGENYDLYSTLVG